MTYHIIAKAPIVIRNAAKNGEQTVIPEGDQAVDQKSFDAFSKDPILAGLMKAGQVRLEVRA